MAHASCNLNRNDIAYINLFGRHRFCWRTAPFLLMSHFLACSVRFPCIFNFSDTEYDSLIMLLNIFCHILCMFLLLCRACSRGDRFVSEFVHASLWSGLFS